MTKREEQYTENLYKKFSVLLDKFMNSNSVEWNKKESILNDFKFMVDERIRELHSEDLFALSTLLQWIWRSQVRDGKSIDIYIPSERMRSLLKLWIDECYSYSGKVA